MADSSPGSSSELQSKSLHNLQTTQNTNKNTSDLEIPIEIVSEEEMALLEAALVATRSFLSSSSVIPSIASPSRPSFLSSSQLRENVRSIESITLLSKRSLSVCAGLDIEDSGNLRSQQKKKNRVSESFLRRFRKKRGLMVTDITGTEWCEKQMEFYLDRGRKKVNKAMKAGSARHLELEKEVVEKVKVEIKTMEDNWALKLINCIVGANQLLFDGLTRELPLVGFAEDVWIVGVIDEIRMPVSVSDRSPVLVDIKTRRQDTLPAQPQVRNGRFQLMLYKSLWDSLVAGNFPTGRFYDYFSLNPHSTLSEEIRETTADAGFPVQTLGEVVTYYRNTWSSLPMSANQLLLRYELQKDHSILAEVPFEHDSNWVESQLHGCLEFWTGEREANFTPEEERWKCRYCQFASECPGNPDSDIARSSSTSANSICSVN
ncbi:exonuclease V, chloroplastic [Carica papaya]|uniref:exonuclease V, chloroplastic n=1 Tax=Carica papaya TaxID=3649 RepID=UPI000B8CEC30|nr:exonuclease V, chloroplastic [Carica papaya]